ncbi:hypothetical protein [Beggiatoa alba]|nr:hypothetical protein [Beggiatoa alba]
MRLLTLLLITLFASLSQAWADTETTTNGNPVEQQIIQLEQRLTELTTHLEQLNQIVNSQIMEELQQLRVDVETLKNQPLEKSAEKPQPATEKEATVLILKGWSYRPEKIKFNNYYAIDVELTNHAGKDILEFDARLNFRDTLGGYLYSINLSRNLNIPAGATRIDQGSRENNRLIGEEHQMRKIQSQDIVVQLVVRRIVFADGSIQRF